MGDRAALGGENGCPRGGEVSSSVWRSYPRLTFISVFTVVFVANMAACSRPSAPALPDPATLLRAIAPADASKYPSLQEAKHWSNPYLVIRADRVGLLTDVAVNEEQILKPNEVLNALAQLPASAWPYGRAVAVLLDERPATPEPDKIALRRNRGIVEGELQDAQVAIRWIPTS
jgi:hypothetical protein